MDALIFVGAAGIAVREIAPYVRDKRTDPAVLGLDERANFVIPLLSGHIGGANALARRLAAALGATAVVTTATDVNGKFSVDTWAAEHGCAISDMGGAKQISAEILEHSVPVCSDFPIQGPLPGGLVLGESGELGIYVGYRCSAPFLHTLRLVPRVLRVGVGCRRGISREAVEEAIGKVFAENRLDPAAILGVFSIDLKEHEPGLLAACAAHGWPAHFYSASQLQAVPGEFTGSDFVRAVTGVENVCERAAFLDAERLLVKKQPATALRLPSRRNIGRQTLAKVFVVGIGPGNYENMTVRADRALAECDVIVGYPVYVDLVKDRYPGKELVSTPMTQEARRCQMALDLAKSGKTVALVCSGDSGIYGMAALVYELRGENSEPEVEVVPGLTAACSGGAVLGAPLTHDFAVISLSDRLTPWETIENRLRCAAEGNFAIAIYNPASHGRPDHLKRACDILLRVLPEERLCGIVRNIGREGQSSRILTLGELQAADVDMFCTVFVGNSSTKVVNGALITPRGYRNV
mgnify:CR=1 FL=1